MGDFKISRAQQDSLGDDDIEILPIRNEAIPVERDPSLDLDDEIVLINEQIQETQRQLDEAIPIAIAEVTRLQRAVNREIARQQRVAEEEIARLQQLINLQIRDIQQALNVNI